MNMNYDELVKFLGGCRRLDTYIETYHTPEPFFDTGGEEIPRTQIVMAVPFKIIGEKVAEVEQELADSISEHIKGKEHVIVRTMPHIKELEKYEPDDAVLYKGVARIIAY